MAQITHFDHEGIRHIFEGALDALIAIDGVGTVLVWNPQAEATFGWSQQEAMSHSLAELIIPAHHRESNALKFRRSAALSVIEVGCASRLSCWGERQVFRVAGRPGSEG